MSIDRIRKDFKERQFRFGPHVVERCAQNGISLEQVIDVVLTGMKTKSEKDERSQGKYSKHTFKKGAIMAVVKDCTPSFLITTNRK